MEFRTLEFRIPASRAQCARFSLRAMRKPPRERNPPPVENPLPPPVEISTASSPLRRYTCIRVEESGLGDAVREQRTRAYAFVEDPINKTMDKAQKVYQFFLYLIGLREHSSSLRVESANISIHLRGRGAWPNPPAPRRCTADSPPSINTWLGGRVARCRSCALHGAR